ncbi:MAG: hypothetical protein EZS28_013199 [Streblomastix strix]|uniref:Integrase catalytic domain-containing protein n=1 Tax=Streblomastix strix TaxID=222440 RepID=A0A5J4W9S8_9EUKA|nr:MAG: hypothetical protein EZS28_013199 [Streblomastix strix]
MANTFLTDKQISENYFIVELEKKRCQCSTPLQVAYFTMDNSSLCLAIANKSWPIKDKKLWDELYPHFFPSTTQAKKQLFPESGDSLNYPFKSKVEHFKKLFGKSPDKIQDIPPDYQIKPLSKLNRPYFSTKLGLWEIDLVFSMDERIFRANQIYLFCININTKYLVVFPLRDKSAGQIKNALQILVKNHHVTNIKSDGEKGFKGIIKESQTQLLDQFIMDLEMIHRNSLIMI